MSLLRLLRGRNFFVLWIALLASPALAAPGKPCLLQKVHKEAVRQGLTEEQILARFRTSEILPASIQRLSTVGGVYQVETTDGFNYILRVESSLVPPRFENFTSQLLNAAPGIETPTIRTLERPEFLSLILLLSSSPKAGTVPPRAAGATVAVHYPKMMLGYDYLEQIGSGDYLRKLLKNWSEFHRPPEEFPDLRADWRVATLAERKALIEDLAKLVPETALMSERQLLTFLQKKGPSIGQDKFNRLLTMRTQRIPSSVLNQLADYWAIYTLLGIPDFHSDNWLIHQGQVLGIDLAFVSKDFSRGRKSLDLVSQQEPFSTHSMTNEVRAMLQRRISGEMRAFLLSLNAARVREIARNSGYQITEVELDGILTRAKLLIEN